MLQCFRAFCLSLIVVCIAGCFEEGVDLGFSGGEAFVAAVDVLTDTCTEGIDHPVTDLVSGVIPAAVCAQNFLDFLETDSENNLAAYPHDGTEESWAWHAGGMRAVEIEGYSSCGDLNAFDALSAFTWVCDDSVHPVRLVSMTMNVELIQLIDVESAIWKDNQVHVFDGETEIYATAPENWWPNNPVQLLSELAGDSDTIILDQSYTVYVIDEIIQPTLEIEADQVALISGPGAHVVGRGDQQASISAWGVSRLWLNLAVTSSVTTVAFAVDLDGVKQVIIPSLVVDKEDSRYGGEEYWYGGVYISGSEYVTIGQVGVDNVHGVGISLIGSDHIEIDTIHVQGNSGEAGFELLSVDDLLINEVLVQNASSDYGFYANNMSGVTIPTLQVENVEGYGVVVLNSEDLTFSDVEVKNNGAGIFVNADESRLKKLVARGNDGLGIFLGGDDSEFSEVKSTNNGGYGIYIGSANRSTFTDIISSGNQVGGFTFGGRENTVENVEIYGNNGGISAFFGYAYDNVFRNFSIYDNANLTIDLTVYYEDGDVEAFVLVEGDVGVSVVDGEVQSVNAAHYADSSRPYVSDYYVSDGNSGVYLDSSSRNRFEDFQVSDTDYWGLYIGSSERNHFVDWTVDNGGWTGIQNYGANTFERIEILGHDTGMDFAGEGGHIVNLSIQGSLELGLDIDASNAVVQQVLVEVSGEHNIIVRDDTVGTVIQNVASDDASGYGFYMDGATSNTILNIASGYHLQTSPLVINEGYPNFFYGVLLLDVAQCQSSFFRTSSSDGNETIVTYDHYDEVGITHDCLPNHVSDFELRTLGSDEEDRQGVLAQPVSNELVTHGWHGLDEETCLAGGGAWAADSCTTKFYANAVELIDGDGNDNGLCEAGESCLYTANIGTDSGERVIELLAELSDGTAMYQSASK